MRILFGHSYLPGGAFGLEWIERWLNRLRRPDLDFTLFPIGLDVPGGRLAWPELDRRWRTGDRQLLTMYDGLARAADGHDAIINFGGVNLHPEFLRQVSPVTVLRFSDDPESSEEFSRHVAAAHDLSMISNVAEVDRYKSWGVERARFCPHGFWAEDFDPTLTHDAILSGERDISLTLLCERLTHWRRQRVDKFAQAFPEGVFRGPGWPQGFLPESERVPTLQRTRVGINIHNSTGPINFRTYYLPANGVLQVCDNKAHLGKIYELGREAVGFDTVDEAIELCRHYLAHDDERRVIAAAGWKRAVTEYNEIACFKVITDGITEVLASRTRTAQSADAVREGIRLHRHETRAARMAHAMMLPVSYPYRTSIRVARGLRRRVHRWWDTARYLLGRTRGPAA